MKVEPKPGCAVEVVFLNNTRLDPVNGVYSFEMPDSNVNIAAQFKTFFTGQSIVLSGDIGMLFYLDPQTVPTGTTVTFKKVTNGESITFPAVELTDSGKTKVTFNNTEYTYYVAMCEVNAAEMSSPITAEITVDGIQCSVTTSVKKYGEYVANNNSDENFSAQNLAQCALDYGTNAQIKFEKNLDDLANKNIFYRTSETASVNISQNEVDMESGLENYGLSYEGTSLLYLNKTTLRHYYKITDQSKFNAVKDSIKFGGAACTYGEKGGYIYFDKPNIGALDLNTAYKLKIGDSTYEFSALDYSKGICEIWEEKGTSSGLMERDAKLAASTYYNNTAAIFYKSVDGGNL